MICCMKIFGNLKKEKRKRLCPLFSISKVFLFFTQTCLFLSVLSTEGSDMKSSAFQGSRRYCGYRTKKLKREEVDTIFEI